MRRGSDDHVHEITKTNFKSPIVFAGFVGPGLAGPLSVGYMIEKLGMQEIGYLRSQYLPPSTVFIQGRLRHPFRFYSDADGTICAIICEVTLRMEGLFNIASTILDWTESKGTREFVILDGVASEEHDGKIFCAAEEDLCRIMQDKGISMISQGFITGIPGSILNECLVRKIKAITLLVRASHTSPDPLAAATLIDAVNKVYGTDINTEDLKKEKERIGNEFKELSEKYREHRKVDSGMYM
ncbi:MAG: PAC2 family protein [Candidatus Nitrosotenuis sp.]